MKNHTITLLSLLWIGIYANGLGQGAILVQHSGSADPTTEGFTLGVSGTGTTILGPVTNDLGMNAWTVGGGNVVNYSQSLTPIPNEDWTLSIDVRVIQSGQGFNPNNWATFLAGNEGFALGFGTDSNGNATVWINNILTGTLPGSQPAFTLSGGGSVYNSYQLDYSAVANTASLWVNGTEEVSDISGVSGFSAWSVDWGRGQGGHSQANWNSVSLSIPEPSSAVLILLGGGGLFYLRRKYHR